MGALGNYNGQREWRAALTQQQSVSVFSSPTWLHVEVVDSYIYGKSQLGGKSSWCQSSPTLEF